MLEGVGYLSVPSGADVKDVTEEIRAALRPV
ncbi:hypothetical protein J2Z19_003767 [Ensifer adhaerens]|uniref:Uncharacterized protein n=1 Tax=Ensifer adhaerens TaxID=106592 RepID=A0ACC5SZK1_ENSAD|nr:hypothetical protein [Ensifer adhaerens]